MSQRNKFTIEMASDSEASFNSLFDEPESAPHNLTSKVGDKPQRKKQLNPPIAALSKRQKVAVPSHSPPKRSTPPRQIRSKPTTPQQIQVSPAPIAKMVSSQKDLPKLSIPQSGSSPTPQRQSRETSTITASTLTSESPSRRQFQQARSPSKPGNPTTTITKPPQSQPEAPFTSPPTPETPPATPPRPHLESTMLKVFLHGSKGYRPLLLKDCLLPSDFFAKITNTWSLPDPTVQQLHITFPWLPLEHNGALMILDRSNVTAGIACICAEVESATRSPADVERARRRSIDVTILPTTTTTMRPMHDAARPRTRDGRSIPEMSVGANRVYWGMRADWQGRVGLHVRQIASMVGMSVADVVVAGGELLEHCLVLTSEGDYDVWSLLEV